MQKLPHRIRRGGWRVAAASLSEAVAVRGRAREAWERVVLPAVEGVFDEFDPGDRVVHIERLNVVLRPTMGDPFGDELAGRMADAVREALRDALADVSAAEMAAGAMAEASTHGTARLGAPSIGRAAAYDHGGMRQDAMSAATGGVPEGRSLREWSFDALMHYLLSGALPWALASDADASAVLRGICREQRAGVAEALRGVARASGWERVMPALVRAARLLHERDARALIGALLRGLARIDAERATRAMARAGDGLDGGVRILNAAGLIAAVVTAAGSHADPRRLLSRLAALPAGELDATGIALLLADVPEGTRAEADRMVEAALRDLRAVPPRRVRVALAARLLSAAMRGGGAVSLFNGGVRSGVKLDGAEIALLELLGVLDDVEIAELAAAVLADLYGSGGGAAIRLLKEVTASPRLSMARAERLRVASRLFAMLMGGARLEDIAPRRAPAGRSGGMDRAPGADGASGDAFSAGESLGDMPDGGESFGWDTGSVAALAPLVPESDRPAFAELFAEACGAPRLGGLDTVAPSASRAGNAPEDGGESRSTAAREAIVPFFEVGAVDPEAGPTTSGGDDEAAGVFPTMIANAGLVLLHPFIVPLFDNLGITAEPPGEDSDGVAGRPRFSEPTLRRAAALLGRLATGRDELQEFELGMCRLLLGLENDDPLLFTDLTVREGDREEADALLSSVVEHWSALKGTSINGLRTSFLQRSGLLRREHDGPRLRVEGAAFDMLLNDLPWSISIVRLPWMPEPIHVEWERA